MSALILDNSSVEDDVIVGAGCVFKGTAKKGYVYLGNPAIKYKERKLKAKYTIEYNPYFR